MPKVSVNLNRVVDTVVDALPGRGDIKKVLQALGASARQEWITLASDEFLSTSRDYIQGISDPEVGTSSVTIQLLGTLPNMLEQGWPKTDMRTTVLKSPHVRTSKAGDKYMVIPFRHGTPGTTGRNVGPAMPRAIHNVARGLAPTTRNPGGGTTPKGEQLSDKIKMSKRAQKILSTKAKPWHSGSIYTGMIRKMGQGATGKAKGAAPTQQPQYQTFRTISDNPKTDPRSWIHPGIRARKLASKVQDHIQQVANQVVQDAIYDS